MLCPQCPTTLPLCHFGGSITLSFHFSSPLSYSTSLSSLLVSTTLSSLSCSRRLIPALSRVSLFSPRGYHQRLQDQYGNVLVAENSMKGEEKFVNICRKNNIPYQVNKPVPYFLGFFSLSFFSRHERYLGEIKFIFPLQRAKWDEIGLRRLLTRHLETT